MRGNIVEIVDCYGMSINPSEDINFVEAMNIIANSQSKMEMVGTGYLYGYMRGSRKRRAGTRQIPVCNIHQMTDDEWNRLAARNKAERQGLDDRTKEKEGITENDTNGNYRIDCPGAAFSVF